MDKQETPVAEIIVRHEVNSPTVVVSKEAVVKAEALKRLARGFNGVVSEETIEQANSVVGDMAKLERQVTQSHRTAKAPVLDLGRAMDEAKRSIIDPLHEERVELSRAIDTYHREVEEKARRIREENRRRIAEEKRKAEEAERERIAALEEAAVGATTPEDMEAAAELAVEAEVLTHQEAVVALTPEPVVRKSPVSRRTRKVLVIDDVTKIPHQVNGLQLLKPDTKAITNLLKANVAVPGCRLEETTSLATRG